MDMPKKKKRIDNPGDLLRRGLALVDVDNTQAAELLKRALLLSKDDAQRGACHDALGILQRRVGDNDAAMTSFRAAIESHRAGKDRSGEARALVHLAGVEIDTSAPGHGLDHLREAFAVAKAHTDPTLEAHVADVLSYALSNVGQHDEARAVSEYGLALLEKSGNPSQLGVSLGNLGVQLQLQGKLKEAEHQYRRALALSERAGDLHNAAIVLCNLASAAVGQGRFVEAAPLIERGIAFHKKMGNRAGEAHGSLLLADVLSVRGDSLGACKLQREAAAQFHHAGNRWMEGVALGNLGNEEATIGALDRARAHHREALDLLRIVGKEHSEGSVLTGAALALAEAGEVGEALTAIRTLSRNLQTLG